MYSFTVSWKVKNTDSSAEDSPHSAPVTANNPKEAIEKVKKGNPATREKMYDIKVEKNHYNNHH